MGKQYELIVSVEGLSSTREEKNKEKVKKVNRGDNTSNINTTGESSGGAAAAKGLALMAAKEVAKVSREAATTYVSQIGARQDNIAKQNRIQNTIEIVGESVSTGLNVLTTTAAGASLGSLASPVGTAVGAAVGAAIAIASEASSKAIEISANLKDYSRLQTTNLLEAEKASERLGRIATNRNR